MVNRRTSRTPAGAARPSTPSLRSRPTTLAGVVGTGVILVLVALWFFQPWRLWTSSVVDEAVPGAAPAGAGTASGAPSGRSTIGQDGARTVRDLAVGAFVSHEHRTSGRVRLLRLPDGSRVLRLEDLATSDGPALHVWLSDRPVTPHGWRVFDDGAHLDLGELKANRGNQNYPVPRTADLTRLTSVSIWCARFRVSFGAAALRLGAG